jgi:hypothetical protein
MAINKKALGIFSLFLGIILLILGIFGINISPAELDFIIIIGLLAPGILFLVIGIILIALYLHSAT